MRRLGGPFLLLEERARFRVGRLGDARVAVPALPEVAEFGVIALAQLLVGELVAAGTATIHQIEAAIVVAGHGDR